MNLIAIILIAIVFAVVIILIVRLKSSRIQSFDDVKKCEHEQVNGDVPYNNQKGREK